MKSYERVALVENIVSLNANIVALVNELRRLR